MNLNNNQKHEKRCLVCSSVACESFASSPMMILASPYRVLNSELLNSVARGIFILMQMQLSGSKIFSL